MRPLSSTHCRNSDSMPRYRGASLMALVIFGVRTSSFARDAAAGATSRKQSTQPYLAHRREHD